MGDRRNVVVQQENGIDIALYTHWSGSELPEILAAALDRGRGRWADPTYLTRIIFSEMIKDDVLSETGFGIEAVENGATNYCEASPGYDLVVSLRCQTVLDDGTEYPFDEFVKTYSGGKVPSITSL